MTVQVGSKPSIRTTAPTAIAHDSNAPSGASVIRDLSRCRQPELGGKQNAEQATHHDGDSSQHGEEACRRRRRGARHRRLLSVCRCCRYRRRRGRLPPYVVVPGGPDVAGAPVLGVLPGDRDVAVAAGVGVSPRGVDLAGRFIAPVLLALNLSLQQSIRSIWRSSRGAALLRRRQLCPDSISPEADQRGELVGRAADSRRDLQHGLDPSCHPNRRGVARQIGKHPGVVAGPACRRVDAVRCRGWIEYQCGGCARAAWRCPRGSASAESLCPGITSSAEHPCSVGMTRETVAPV